DLCGLAETTVAMSAPVSVDKLRCGYVRKENADTALKYFPFRAMIEASKDAPYHKKFNLLIEGCRYNARQKSRRWAVLEVLLIVGTFC
nr:hypothetical protein [Alistipes sp.]